MKNPKKIYIITTILTICFTISSCKKFVEVAAPIDQITAEAVFKDDATATSAVIGLYDQMMTSNLYFMNGAVSFYTALSSDELYNTTTSTTISPFYSNGIPANSSIIATNFWRYGYNYIYQANVCIENIAHSTTLSPQVKQELTGEMLFARAVCYFYMVNLFGDVPLETSTDYKVNEVMSRTTSGKIYEQIKTDLVQAESLLGTNYPTSLKVRPNRYAASAMLARVYLYLKDYTNAVSEATTVISSGTYSLSPLTGIFLANSGEAIWQLVPVSTTYNTAEGATFIPSSTTVKPSYALTNYLLNAFESGDQRKTNWLKSNTVSSVAYFYPYKYKVRSSSTKTEYNTVLRLAELYLIRAEAKAQLNDLPGAISDVNTIRLRAGLPNLASTLTQAQALTSVAQENRIEFLSEWGHRWLDLKRTGQADAILGTEKTGWTSAAALYPIPLAEIQRNTSLTQNPSY